MHPGLEPAERPCAASLRMPWAALLDQVMRPLRGVVAAVEAPDDVARLEELVTLATRAIGQRARYHATSALRAQECPPARWRRVGRDVQLAHLAAQLAATINDSAWHRAVSN